MSVMAENAGNAPNHSLLYAHHDDIFLICGVFMSASIWDIHYSLFILSESHSPLILTGAILFRMNRLYVCTHVWTMNTTVHEKAFPPCLLLYTNSARTLALSLYHVPYKHVLAVCSWPPSREWGSSGCLFMSSRPLPYKHSTSGPPMGRQWLATPGWQADPHPLGGSGLVCKVGRQWQATTEPTLLSLCLPLCLLMFHFTGFRGEQPTSSRHSPNLSCTGSASSLIWLAG